MMGGGDFGGGELGELEAGGAHRLVHIWKSNRHRLMSSALGRNSMRGIEASWGIENTR